MIEPDVPSLKDKFDELNEKLDRIAKGVALLLAASAQLPVDVDLKFLKELGHDPMQSPVITL